MQPQVVVVAATGSGRAAATNSALRRAFADSAASWCVVLQADQAPLPGHLQAFCEAVAAPLPPGSLPGLWVGSTARSPATQPSPLARFLVQQTQARQGSAGFGDAVPADWVFCGNYAVHRAAFAAAGGLTETLHAGLEVVDFARRLYVGGASLRACPAAKVRWQPSWQVAQAVAHWQAQGSQLLALLQRHQDPHGLQRLVERLGPFCALLPQAQQLAQQLHQVETQLVALRRPQPGICAQLQPSFQQLYATSVLQGVLASPGAAALWPAPARTAGSPHRPAHA